MVRPDARMFALGLTAAVFLGCGSEASPAGRAEGTGSTTSTGTPGRDGTDGGHRNEAWSKACRDVAQAICSALVSCGCRFDIRDYDATNCADTLSEECADIDAQLAEDLDQGRWMVSDPLRARCVSELAAQTCDRPDLPDACTLMLQPKVATGEACALDGPYERLCADGAGSCDEASGLCVALSSAGGPCLRGRCSEGLVCRSGVCLAPLGDGDSCSTSSLSEDPLRNPCASGLVCHMDGICGVARGEGAECAMDAQCQVGFRCQDTCVPATGLGSSCVPGRAVCGAARGCQRSPEMRTCVEPGEPGDACTCSTSSSCLTSSCGSGSSCNAQTQLCEALAAEGSFCDPTQRCAESLQCENNVCVPTPGLDESCADGMTCARGLGCDPLAYKCSEPGGLNEPCPKTGPSEYSCAEPLACATRQQVPACVDKVGLGESCAEGDVCDDSTYCDASSSTCVARLRTGEPCERSAQCPRGEECATVGGTARCRSIPTRGEPCETTCSEGLACDGLGGTCSPAFCVVDPRPL